ncbi:carboxymethylenebutenolidase [Nostoc sp. 3335mG]|nr:carboxymethylenebutenolidase [Nostoc sp. 3335mG]
MTDDLRQRAIRIYDAFTHEHLDRRRLLRDMTGIAGSVAAAELLIAGIAASPVSAQQVPADDKRLVARRHDYSADGTAMSGYLVEPAGKKTRRGAVMVIHENRGLTAHIEDVARRVALDGFTAFAPDFLTPSGGTPKGDDDRARQMIGALDLAKTVQIGVSTLAMLRGLKGTNGKVGAVGFCWGGAMVNRLAVAAGTGLDAGVAYYGPAPTPAEASKVQAALLLHYAGNDARVNATAEPWVAALKADRKHVESFTYAGVEHAFNNDTSAERYNAEAAALAWGRTIAFLRRHLAG